jgi:hypothetical protein
MNIITKLLSISMKPAGTFIIYQNILDVFNKNNVQIITPVYVTYPQTPKVVPKGQWEIPLADSHLE